MPPSLTVPGSACRRGGNAIDRIEGNPHVTDPNLSEQPAVPPVPPAPPAATEVPAAPAAPAYGAAQPPAAPAYGQPAAPAYAQPAPAYGQAAYGQPAYGQPAYGQPAYGQAPAKTNVLAIISLVSAFFVSLAAVITGHIALNQIKKTGEQGRGLAIAGLVIGYVGLVAGIIWIIAVIAILVAGAAAGASYSGTY